MNEISDSDHDSMEDHSSGDRTVIGRVRGISRAAKVVIIGAVFLGLLAVSGVLRADNGFNVSSEQAIEIATGQLDFEPDLTVVKLTRQGVALDGVWAVSFSIEGQGGQEFERLRVVEIDAVTGEVLRVTGN